MTKEQLLIQAVRDGDLAAVKALVEDGADVNALVDNLQRAVAHPGAGDRVAIVRYLLENGADPHLPAYDQGSALDLWAYEGDAAVVQVLLEHGADPNLGTAPSGETPLHYATSRGHMPGTTECVRLLLEAGADPNRPAKVGIETTAYMRDIRVRGETPLHRAAIHGDEGMIQHLLDYGADPSIKDAHDESPLCWASWARRPVSVLKMLLYGKFLGSIH